MILTPDEKDSSKLSDLKGQTEDLQPDLQEPPPSYSPPSEPVASGSSSFAPFKTQPTNFLAMSNSNDSIKGQFVIDPSLPIPSNMLPPLHEGETEADRKNLSLRSKNGSVHVDVWLIGSPRDGATKSRRTTIALASQHGSISAQVQTFDGAAPFSLTASTPHGSIRTAIPRSFQGLASLSTRHGDISLSEAIIENATQLSQVGDMRRYFIGDFSLLGEGEWDGDQIVLESTHGSVRMKYVEELAESHGKKGLLSRLFGR